ncbi:MAG: serine hydrolase [bacterium]|nr:serine hydrolase [bacterium]
MSFKQKLLDWFSSYGLMVLGVILIFSATVSFKTGHYPVLKFSEIVVGASNSRMSVVGGDTEIKTLPVSHPIIPLAKDGSEFTGKLSAQAALVLDDSTDTVLYNFNSEIPRPLASITKLMSMLVLSDLPIRWASTTVVLEDDCDSSSHHIVPGEKYTLDDLWHIALIGSSNSAVRVLVRASGLTQESFVALMNKKAAALGLTSAKFTDPTGLDAGNMANALDTAKLLRESLKNKKIAEATRIGEYYARPLDSKKPKRIWSTDWLLTNWIPNKFAKDCIAGKTGYIVDSGYNFAVWLKDDAGHTVRVVILGANSNESRFSEARDLAMWAFEHYSWQGDVGYDRLVE